MKPGEEGSESLDTFIRQAVAKEPVAPFPRPTADSPVQWIQLLQALDYQGSVLLLHLHLRFLFTLFNFNGQTVD